MVCAYRDRKAAERERQLADLRFLAAALGADVREAPKAETAALTPQRGKVAEVAQFLRGLGGRVEYVG